jgi:transcriptional regulator with XRE-family HTH domain
MARLLDPRTVFRTRLKQARQAAGLSQKQLGIRAEMDPFVASTRINRYEKGIHEADLHTAARLARAMDVPLPYLYTQDERLARMILGFAKLTRMEQDALVQEIEARCAERSKRDSSEQKSK